MKSKKSLRRQQKQMRSRTANPRGRGRPRKIFTDKDEERVWKLLDQDYTPAEIADELGVTLRTLAQSFPYLAPGAATRPSARDQLRCYQQAMAGSVRAIRLLLRKSGARLGRRRAWQESGPDYKD